MAKKALAKKETVKTEPVAKGPAKKDVAKSSSAKKSALEKSAVIKETAKKVTKKDAVKEVAVPKAAEPATVRKAPPTLTTSEIGDHLAVTFDIPKSHAKIYLTEAVALIGKSLKKGNKVRISGLGVFQVKKRAARKGRNPNTGEPIKIKASKRVGFAVARDLKVKL